LNSLIQQLKAKIASQRLAEDMLIELVLDEQAQGHIDKVAMAKAKIQAKGDSELANTLYINHRITRIKDNDFANLAAFKKLIQNSKSSSELQEERENRSFEIVLYLLAAVPALIALSLLLP